MNLYSFSVLVFAIGSAFMGIQIFLKRKDGAGVAYFGLSCLYFVWGIGFSFMVGGALSFSETLFWIRVSNVAAVLIPVVWLHFCLIYTNRMPENKWVILLMYVEPVLVMTGAFSDNFIPSLRSIVGFKYYAMPGFLYNLHVSIYLVGVPTGFYQLWKMIQTLSGDEKKKQQGFLFVSFLGYLGGGLSFLPVYDIPVPQYGLLLLPLYPFGKAYFMSVKGLFDEERLAQAAHKDKLAALGILTASINHEIRGPLFLMRGTIETELENKKNVSAEAGQRVIKQMDRITDIVSRLTHFAKKGVEEEAKIEVLDLKEILSDVRPLFQHQLSYQGIEYNQDIPADLPKVLADRRYLEEIIFNLILNACQALREKPNPKIELRCFTSDSTNPDGANTVLIAISDNGPGIKPNQIKHIFKPFHTTKTEGTGLGLYITQQLVEKCGGKISIDAKTSQGAKFILQFKSEKLSG